MKTNLFSVEKKEIAAKNERQNARGEGQTRPKVVLLEHDMRFNVFPEFVFYDFQQPFKLPGRRVLKKYTRPERSLIEWCR